MNQVYLYRISLFEHVIQTSQFKDNQPVRISQLEQNHSGKVKSGTLAAHYMLHDFSGNIWNIDEILFFTFVPIHVIIFMFGVFWQVDMSFSRRVYGLWTQGGTDMGESMVTSFTIEYGPSTDDLFTYQRAANTTFVSSNNSVKSYHWQKNFCFNTNAKVKYSTFLGDR